MYDLVRGPMVWVALIVFGFGLVIQGIRFFRLTGEKERRVGLALPRKKKSKKKKKTPWLEWWSAWFSARYDKWLRFYRGSIIQTHPVMILVTIVFHGLLFVIPLFLLAHNLLIAKSLGVSLCSFSESVSHFLTVVFLFCVVFFLLRRVFVRRVRAITSMYDYLVLLVTAAPFVSGYLAHSHWGDYQTVMLVHMISGELMLIVVPFTKLGHMLYFFMYRIFIGSEYSFGQGSRAW